MRTRTRILIALLMVAGLAGGAYGVTFLSDDGGRVAPLCSFLGSSNAPEFCGTTNPLPVTSSAATSANDPIGFGRAWFQSAGIPVPNAREWVGMLIDQNNAVAAGPSGGLLQVVFSRDGGRTFTTGFTSGVALGDQSEMIRLTDGSFLLAGDAGGLPSILRTTDFANVGAAAGLPGAGRMVTVRQFGTTILAAQTVGSICRSTNNAASFTCADPAALAAMGRQSLAPVTTNVWIAIDNAGQIGRSIDDGATWAAVGGAIPAPDADNHAVVCLSATICLATGGTTIVRSTNGGVSFPSTPFATTGTMSGRLAGFANFGNGVVTAVLAPINSGTQILSYRSTDFGVTWTPGSAGTNATFPNGNGANGVSVVGGQGFYMVHSSAGAGLPNAAGFYSQSLGGGSTLVKGENGATWNIDSNGSGVVVQGTATGTFPSFTTMPFIVSSPANNQGTNLTVSQTGAANAVNTVTLTGAANTKIYLYHLSAFCAPAGVAVLTVAADGAVVRHTVPVPTTPAVYSDNFTSALQNGTVSFGQNMLVSATACGVGNTSTINVNAFRW